MVNVGARQGGEVLIAVKLTTDLAVAFQIAASMVYMILKVKSAYVLTTGQDQTAQEVSILLKILFNIYYIQYFL